MPTPRSKVKVTANKKPLKEANGAIQESPKATLTAAAPIAAQTNSPTTHQTHGGYTPITGPITTAQQLYRGPKIAKSSIGSFSSIESYGAHIRTLPIAELHRHAIDDAHIVAIDDRDRLIKRLESQWTESHARETQGGASAGVPKRMPFSTEQKAKQDEIRNKLLRGGR